MPSTHLLKGMLGFESGMSVEMGLELDIYKVGSRVHKDASTQVHAVLGTSSMGLKSSAMSAAYAVVDRDSLARQQLFSIDDSLVVFDNIGSSSRCRSGSLFSKLTGCTLGVGSKLGGCVMESLLGCGGKDA